MSCLFDSLSYFTLSDDGNSLRQKITAYINEDPILIQPNTRLSNILQIQDVGFQNYVNSMRSANTWGGAIEIKAFCELYRIPVHVLVESTGSTIEFIPNQHPRNSSNFILISWNGHHFEPVKHK